MFECKCSLRQSALGDGCMICNTDYYIDTLPTPEELEQELWLSFTEDQAFEIAADVYQPLLSIISTLNEKINQLERKLEDKVK